MAPTWPYVLDHCPVRIFHHFGEISFGGLVSCDELVFGDKCDDPWCPRCDANAPHHAQQTRPTPLSSYHALQCLENIVENNAHYAVSKHEACPNIKTERGLISPQNFSPLFSYPINFVLTPQKPFLMVPFTDIRLLHCPVQIIGTDIGDCAPNTSSADMAFTFI